MMTAAELTRKPSPSISEATDGKVLVHCHAEQEQVIDALKGRGCHHEPDVA
jgi:hypothetical protein